jgi:hypothetical protein
MCRALVLRTAGFFLALATAAVAQKRNIDHWEGLVLNCGSAAAAPIAGDLCQTWIGEMRKRADAAKIKLVAIPIFADDLTLDRRAAEEGLGALLNHLHVRLDISPPTGSLRSRDFTLSLRSFNPGPFASGRKEGDYPVLNFTPGAIANEGSAMALGVAAILADSFFVRMLRTQL